MTYYGISLALGGLPGSIYITFMIAVRRCAGRYGGGAGAGRGAEGARGAPSWRRFFTAAGSEIVEKCTCISRVQVGWDGMTRYLT